MPSSLKNLINDPCGISLFSYFLTLRLLKIESTIDIKIDSDRIAFNSEEAIKIIPLKKLKIKWIPNIRF